ncbi:MAG: sugar phosphate isomerase/epimerase [Oscillospiraceae bacterium]|nr:sugar phosphate isomerase/epimerase [Oscillospiraceae bacterium]
MKTGLCSVSFRKLTVEEIIAAVKDAGLDGIEWGGDVHVPHGDVEKARYVAKLMKEAGLETLSYGTYYYSGDHAVEDFKGVIDCALALGTKILRVWAGSKTLTEVTDEYRAKIIADTKALCEMAKPHGLTVAYEYHGWTLTETLESAVQAYAEVGEENMKMYWQPSIFKSDEENMEALKAMLPSCCNLHMFHWDAEYHRYALEEGADVVKQYLDLAKTSPNIYGVMLEFIKDDSLEQMKADAAVLNKLAK